MTARHAQLTRFRILMEGFVAAFRDHDPTSLLLGFNEGMIRDMHALADAIGWCKWCTHPSGRFKMPVCRHGDFGITIFDAYGGGAASLSIVVPLHDELEESFGAKLKEGTWTYSHAATARLNRYCTDRKQRIIMQLMPLLKSWLIKADEELAAEAAVASLSSTTSPAGTARSGGYSTATLCMMAGVSNTTINKYAKHAGIATPARGRQDHTYTRDEAKTILEAGRSKSTQRRKIEGFRAALEQLGKQN